MANKSGYNLQRFVDAQRGDYARALAEVRGGHKRTHWIWYIFPQIHGLGYSSTSKYYAIADLGEAKVFLADPSLGANLREITKALLDLPTSDPHAVFGSPDDMKVRSCMTLFATAAPEGSADERLFLDVLEKFYDGKKDPRTLEILAKDAQG